MNTEHATPEVIDAIARIELQRQKREKESGVPASCSWALGKLYELLPGERKSTGTNAKSAALQGNIDAATLAIGRLRKLAQATGQRTKSDRPWHQQNPGGMRKKNSVSTRSAR